jgi:LysM repeat protein
MNNSNPNPFLPQGSLLEQKNKLRSRVRTAFLCVVGVPAAAILVALLAQGCREQPAPPPEPPVTPVIETTNPPTMDTNPPPVVPTNPLPVVLTPVIPAGATKYKVTKGDNFTTIRKKFGVSVKAIQEANPGVDSTKLKVDQELNIPAPSAPAAGAGEPVATAAGEQLYEVKSGDTLTSIARNHGTTVKAIETANNLTSTRIKVGEKLKVPAKAAATTLPPAK